MELVRVNEKNAKYFAGMAPRDVLGYLSMPDTYGIGAVRKKEAVGLLVYTRSKNMPLTIKWLYCDSYRRGKGIGAELLQKAFELAKAMKISRIRAVMHADVDFEAMQLYLLNWGFGWREEIPDAWHITAEDFLNSEAMKNAAKSQLFIKSLTRLESMEIKDQLTLLKMISETPTAKKLYDTAGQKSRIDEKLSIIQKYGSEIESCVLMQRSGSVIYPIAYFSLSEEKEDKLFLVKATLINAAKNMKKGDEIVITTSDPILNEAMADIFPDIVSEKRMMMTAETDYLDEIMSEYNDEVYPNRSLFLPEDIPVRGFEAVEAEIR